MQIYNSCHYRRFSSDGYDERAIMTALVLDAHLKSSLAAIRSLGMRGVSIVAGSHRRTAMGLFSRYVQDTFTYPQPLCDQRGFVEAVIEKSKAIGKPVVLAFSDASLLPLVRQRHCTGDHWIYLSPGNTSHFEIPFDKARTLELAQRIGVEIPNTFFSTDKAGLTRCLHAITYPAVVKPRRSVSWTGNVGTHSTAVYALSAEDLERKCAEVVARTQEFPLVQEYVRGEEACVEFLCDRGKILAACAHRRIRSLCPSGGPSVVKQTVPLSYCGINQRAERLLAELHWSGPIMVEFKIDRRSGIPKLMEINGRFWGSLPLAIAAGVDFPGLYYRLACGEHIEPSTEYAAGIVSRHFLADCRNLLWALFKNDPIRPFAYPSRLQAVKEFLISPAHCLADIRDPRDMAPVFAEIVDIVARLTPKTLMPQAFIAAVEPNGVVRTTREAAHTVLTK